MVCDDKRERAKAIRHALATLDGLTIYGSKFKVGDEVWCILNHNGKRWALDEALPVDVVTCDGMVWHGEEGSTPESDCFPTREEAEAECAKRNQKGSE